MPRHQPVPGSGVAGDTAMAVLLTSTASDAHTWNLVYLQALLEELGCSVTNLGPCVPDELVLDAGRRLQPALIVVSTINGHGYQDGELLIRRIRRTAELAATPTVIGGKLGTHGDGDTSCADRLLAAGFDAVFKDEGDLPQFRSFVTAMRYGVAA